jgi:hypothetical protein
LSQSGECPVGSASRDSLSEWRVIQTEQPDGLVDIGSSNLIFEVKQLGGNDEELVLVGSWNILIVISLSVSL